MPGRVGDRAHGFLFSPALEEPAGDESSDGLSGAWLFGELGLVHALPDLESHRDLPGSFRNGLIHVSGHESLSLRSLRKIGQTQKRGRFLGHGAWKAPPLFIHSIGMGSVISAFHFIMTEKFITPVVAVFIAVFDLFVFAEKHDSA